MKKRIILAIITLTLIAALIAAGLVFYQKNKVSKLETKKAQLESTRTSLQQTYDIAAANAAKMKQMHDKLSKDIGELNARKDAIKAKLAVAKTQQSINKLGSSVSGVEGNMSAFARMEAKADNMLDKANAMAELNEIPRDEAEDLAAKYEDNSAASPAVDDELAALKAKLGK